MKSTGHRAVTVLMALAILVAACATVTPVGQAAYEQAHWVERSIPGVAGGIIDIQVQAGTTERVTAVVSVSNNLYSSQNGGTTWTPTPSTSGTPFLALAESKSIPGEFFALDSNVDTYRSSNGGGSWSLTSTFASPGFSFDTGSDPDSLVATTSLAATWYSNDRASSWISVASPLVNSEAVAGDPDTADVFYAAEQAPLTAPVFRSDDGGQNWVVCGVFPNAVHVTSISVFPYGGPVLAATDTLAVDALYRSNDGGLSWTASATGFPPGTRVFSLAVSGLSPYIAYAATDSGIFASYDCGTSWSDISGDLPSKTYRSVSASGGQLGAVFVGTDDGKIYRSISPFLTGIDPDSGSTGDLVTLSGVNLGSRAGSHVSFAGIDTTDCASWSDDRIEVYVPEGAQSGGVTVTTPEGRSNAVDFTITSPEPTLYNWYLAEGSTGISEEGNFETWVLVQNPGDQSADVEITYMTGEEPVDGPVPELDPNTRQSVNVADTLDNVWSVSTKVTSNQPVIAERSMYWNTPEVYRQAAHDSIGVSAAAKTWFLAEGCTGISEEGNFETWVLVQNPGGSTADVTLTYMTPSGAIEGPSLELDPNTRQSVNVADTLDNVWSVSTKVTSNQPVIAERSMYWNTPGVYRQAAHDSIGVSAAAKTWFLAEGCTGISEEGNFETWVLVQNPGESTADVTLTYMTPSGAIEGPSLELDPNTRQSVNVADTLDNV
ncbi:MAG: IPT/TIG domain-containing protein, partial [Actinobacteria bacterium]|nr:IPT/TIG domain-containing protein [Actinomycetota bacterium]